MRLIDADALLAHECEATKMDVRLVVGKGYILDAPTINPLIQGRWKGAGMGDYMCSWCNEVYNGKSNFCPNCGADMR
jgi:rubrerythrin